MMKSLGDGYWSMLLEAPLRDCLAQDGSMPARKIGFKFRHMST